MISDDKLRVLILSPFFRPNIGGVETHLTDLTEYLRSKGHMVYVITYTPLTTRVSDVPLIEKLEKLEVYRIKWIGRGLFFKLDSYFPLQFFYLFPLLFIYTLIFMLKRKADVIHAHGLIAASAAVILSRVFKTRAVMSVHCMFNFKRRPLLRILSKPILSSLTTILSLSETSKSDIASVGIPKDKIRIYTHWVNQELFKPPKNKIEGRGKLGLEREDFIVLFVGRLLDIKGVDVLLKVAKRCPLNIKFLFIGAGPMKSRIMKVSEKLSNVKLIDKVPVKTLVEYYGVADIVAVPSQYDEGFARVVLEALSCDTPVLAASKGCLPEMINSTVGSLVNPNVERLYEQIMYLYKNRKKLKKLASNCRKYAEEKYSERNAKIIEKAYMERS
jgi:glycosyltransferase involved in cell wall biosynthesis